MPLDILAVEDAWRRVVMEEWSDSLRELAELPLGQRRILKYIANFDGKNMQGHEACILKWTKKEKT